MDVVYSGFELPIRIDYRPPRWLKPFIIVSHLLAVICVLLTSLPPLFKIILVLYAIVNLVVTGKKAAANSHDFLHIYLNSDDQWFVRIADDDSKKARLISAGVVFPELIILRLQTIDENRYDCIITVYTTDKHTLRRLRARLFYPKGGGGRKKSEPQLRKPCDP
jgi:hypothetical protein